MAQVTLKSGFDVDYHLEPGRRRLPPDRRGEPPGRWMGRGAEASACPGASAGPAPRQGERRGHAGPVPP